VATVICLSEAVAAEFLLNLAEDAEINDFSGGSLGMHRIPLEIFSGVVYKLEEEPVGSSPAGLGSPSLGASFGGSCPVMFGVVNAFALWLRSIHG
jgi:hypothetical protein